LVKAELIEMLYHRRGRNHARSFHWWKTHTTHGLI